MGRTFYNTIKNNQSFRIKIKWNIFLQIRKKKYNKNVPLKMDP